MEHMKRVLQGSIIAMAALLISSCEQTIDVDLPYARRLVFNGFIIADSGTIRTAGMGLTKTVPVLDVIDSANVVVNDAKMWIRSEDRRLLMTRSSDPKYFMFPEVVETWQGRTVTVIAEGEGLTASATTRIPLSPRLLSTEIGDTVYPWGDAYNVVKASIEVESGTVAWCESYAFYSATFFNPLDWQWGVTSSVQHASGLDTIVVRREVYISDTTEYLYIDIFCADGIYQRYLQSPYGDASDPFGFGGVNPYFNVEGYGIGLAIGVAAIRRRVAVRP
jgi:hypothetical protein